MWRSRFQRLVDDFSQFGHLHLLLKLFISNQVMEYLLRNHSGVTTVTPDHDIIAIHKCNTNIV
jgi:hypothetical protein